MVRAPEEDEERGEARDGGGDGRRPRGGFLRRGCQRRPRLRPAPCEQREEGDEGDTAEQEALHASARRLRRAGEEEQGRVSDGRKAGSDGDARDAPEHSLRQARSPPAHKDVDNQEADEDGRREGEDRVHGPPGPQSA